MLGLAFAAPPGPVTTEAVRRGLAGGFWPSFLVGLGSLLGDSVWAFVALAGAAFVVENEAARMVLGVGGAVWLAWLAARALRAARSASMPQASARLTRGSDLIVGAVAALANPYVAAYWLAVGGGVTVALVESGERLGLVVFFVGFVLACILWCAFLSLLVGIAHRRVTERFLRAANLFAACVLGGFALLLLWKLAGDVA